MRTALLVMLTLATLSCLGCRDEFTRERYETLYEGQPAWDVAETLGEPTRRENGKWVYLRTESPICSAWIFFEDGRLVDKRWFYSLPPESSSAGAVLD